MRHRLTPKQQRRRELRMGEENKVILHGMWASPYVKRVELALKFKGIPYEYVEEDFQNKSQTLLEYNPVYKKVPVLIHNGKPIAESHVILEYIDETWKTEPKILPDDPYERARTRFWAAYFQQVLDSSRVLLFTTDKEKQQKGLEEVYEKLGMLEEGIKELGVPGKPHLGLLDIMAASSLASYKTFEQVLGVQMLNPEKNPLIFSWVNSLIEVPEVKQVTPDQEKLASRIQLFRTN